MITEIENPKIAFGKIGAMKILSLKKSHVQSEWNEGRYDEEGDGYWVALKPGWKSAEDMLGCVHCIHEDTRRECYQVGVVECDCDDCKREAASLPSAEVRQDE